MAVKKRSWDHSSDQIAIRMQKGFKEFMRKSARARGLSPNRFIVATIANALRVRVDDAVCERKDRVVLPPITAQIAPASPRKTRTTKKSSDRPSPP